MISTPPRLISFLSLTVCALLGASAQAQNSSFSVSVDQSFLGAGSDETAAWAPCPFGSLCPRNGEVWGTDSPIDLASVGIGEGDLVELTAVGSFISDRPNPFPWIFSGDSNQSISSKMIAVFSTENTVMSCSGFTVSSCAGLDDTTPPTPRVSSAIDTGIDYDTGFMGLSEATAFDTDTVEDFFVPTTGVEVIVPTGARYLWAAPHDDKKSTGPYGRLHYGNQSNGGFWIDIELIASATTTDTDGDGIGDPLDNCVFDINPIQEDLDLDSVENVYDNCPGEANANQEDENGNGVGDACEPISPSEVFALSTFGRVLLLGFLTLGTLRFIRRSTQN